VLDLVKATAFDSADFTIRGDGVVRLNPQLARHCGWTGSASVFFRPLGVLGEGVPISTNAEASLVYRRSGRRR
jgi:hypothetical protein